MRERETKLSVAPDLALPDLSDAGNGVVAESLPVRQLRTTYYDTADLRLARWGCSLRHRADEGWTVKLPLGRDGTLVVRDEIVFDAPAGKPPADAVDLVRAYVRDEPLRPVVALRTSRHPVALIDSEGRRLAELTDDRVAVLEGRRVARRFREVEIELAEQTPDGSLDWLVERLLAAGGEPSEVASKYLQALGDRELDPPEVVVGELRGDASVVELLRHELSAAVLRVMRQDPGVRLGEDPEAVHQARVGTRRVRSSLRTFDTVLEPDWTSRLRAEAKWLADRLGEVRDADVLLARLRGDIAQLPEADQQPARRLLERLRRQRAGARTQLLEAMREDRYTRLLEDLLGAASAPAVVDGDRPAAATLVPLVAGAWRKLRREVRRAGDEPSDEQLHAIRIRAKRCRYAAEMVAPVVGAPATRFAAGAEAIQEILGDHHDAIVAQAWLREAAAGWSGSRGAGAAGQAGRGVLLAAGELIAAEGAAAGRTRAGWEDAWRRLDRKKLRAWLS
jgi:CHAD domain-containing protein